MERSRDLFARARRVIPGGVNSPARAFRAVGGEPPFLARGAGSRVWDADGREYLDYVGSWGPLILGHAHPEVIGAVEAAARGGTTFGAPTEREVLLAERLVRLFPSISKVRMVCSGTEAAMSALRAARGFSGRDRIVKCDGGYHGHSDMLLVRAGSAATTLGLPGSAGVPEGAARDTAVVPYNDLSAAREALGDGRAAAFIVEPIAANMGVVPPRAGYLEGLRALCDQTGALLILDEVVTGLRLRAGSCTDVRGDLTVLGKIAGGGLPAAAYGGRADVMDRIAPDGPVYQAGTLAGNPLAAAAALATLDVLERDPPYPRLDALGARLGDGLVALCRERGTPACVQRAGSMLTLFFTEGPVTDHASAKRADTARFARFHRALLDRGVYWPCSQFEAAFVSAAHTDADVDRTLEIVREALR